MQDQSPPPAQVDAPLVKLIGQARREIRQSFWARFAPFGLTPQQGWILRVLGAQGAMSLHVLSQWVFMDDPTACRIVKTLQDKGLVESQPDPDHGRRVLISLTPQGAARVPDLDRVAEQLGQDLERGLSPDQLRTLRSALVQVIANLSPINS